MEMPNIQAADADMSTIFSELSDRKIYFGHMSVGNNILEGVQQILDQQRNVRFDVARGDDPQLFDRHSLIHSSIGKNGDPISKVDDFAKKIRSGIGDRADIAMFKFCFVDIGEQTDIEAVYRHYYSTMKALSAEYPKTQFVHITVPLTTLQKGPKSIVKRILGMDIGLEDNAARNQYNKMLTDRQSGLRPVFDLAGAESTHPDGSREYRHFEEDRVYLMIPSYTYDSGHLSEKGRLWVGTSFLQFLASI